MKLLTYIPANLVLISKCISVVRYMTNYRIENIKSTNGEKLYSAWTDTKSD